MLDIYKPPTVQRPVLEESSSTSVMTIANQSLDRSYRPLRFDDSIPDFFGMNETLYKIDTSGRFFDKRLHVLKLE